MDFAREVTVIRDGTARRNGLARLAFAVAVVVNAGSCVTASTGSSLLLAAFGSFLVFPVCVYFLFAAARRVEAHASIAIDDESLVLVQRGRRTSLPFTKIRGAWVEGDTWTTIVTRGESITMNLASPAAAEELVSQLGHTKEQRTLAMPVAGWVKTGIDRSTTAAVIVIMFMVTGFFAVVTGALLADRVRYISLDYELSLAAVLTLVTLVACLNLLSHATRPRWVVVGSDGVRLANGKIVHHSDIERADPAPTGVRISRKDDSHVTIEFSQGADTAAVWVERQFALLSRIEWWKQNAARTEQEARLAILDRGGRPLAEHRKALHMVADTGGLPRAERQRGGPRARDRQRGEPGRAARGGDGRAIGLRPRASHGEDPRGGAHMRGPQAARRAPARRHRGGLRGGAQTARRSSQNDVARLGVGPALARMRA